MREWVLGCYVATYADDTVEETTGEARGCAEHVARGGYFGSYEEVNLRASARAHFMPEHARYGIGLRCARSLP